MKKIVMTLICAVIATQAWAADGPLPAVAESQSRTGNIKGSLIQGTLITTHDATKEEQDWYAITLATSVRVIGKPTYGNDPKQSFSSCMGMEIYERSSESPKKQQGTKP